MSPCKRQHPLRSELSCGRNVAPAGAENGLGWLSGDEDLGSGRPGGGSEAGGPAGGQLLGLLLYHQDWSGIR